MGSVSILLPLRDDGVKKVYNGCICKKQDGIYLPEEVKGKAIISAIIYHYDYDGYGSIEVKKPEDPISVWWTQSGGGYWGKTENLYDLNANKLKVLSLGAFLYSVIEYRQ